MIGSVVLDLDGVVYLEDRAVPGALRAMMALETAGYRLVFCTNNSSRTPAQVAAKLRRITGYPARGRQVLSSAEAAARLLAEDRPLCLVLGGAGIDHALSTAGIAVTTDWSKAGAVVVGVDFDLTYGRLRDAVRAVRGGARLVATNLDPTYPTPDGEWPGAGAIVASVETAAGVDAEPAGKPFKPMRDLLKENLGPGPVWVVGDRVETDLAMAAAEPGWRGILVLTGVTTPSDHLNPTTHLVAADLTEAAHLIMET
jgi:4-nitrophenyl phosphatase